MLASEGDEVVPKPGSVNQDGHGVRLLKPSLHRLRDIARLRDEHRGRTRRDGFRRGIPPRGRSVDDDNRSSGTFGDAGSDRE